MFTWIQQLIRGILKTIIALTLLASFIAIWFGIGIRQEARWTVTSSAFWMEHAWASGEQQDYEVLRERIKSHRIQDLYFHVGPIQEDGSLADDLQLPLPDLPTTDYAWIGQLRSRVDLNDAAVREQVVNSARWLINNGFEGIHVNIEPVPRDDTAFILLMEELRQELPEDAKLSVAMDEWQPHGPSRLLSWLLGVPIESYWSTAQVKDISEHVDQMVVMTYDTSFQNPKLYIWWVEQQLITLSRRISDQAELRVGIPSYEEGPAIDPNVENLMTGFEGYRRGITNVRSRKDRLSGISVYSYWEMEPAEWTILEQLLKPKYP